jgi:hypothetical protein
MLAERPHYFGFFHPDYDLKLRLLLLKLGQGIAL